VDIAFYQLPARITELHEEQVRLLDSIDGEPETLCRVAQGLLVQTDVAARGGVPAARQEERNIRLVADILRTVLDLGAEPLVQPRAIDRRVVGTCRHFAVLSCALLRAKGISARARCGFAGYFMPGLHVDHWVTEYWATAAQRWVRVDSEIIGTDLGLVARPNDLATGEFLSGGEAWALYRTGARDPMTFGVHGTDHAWGAAEIVGNAIRDLAALNKVEMLPWDEWGPMDECYRGEILPDVARLIDAIADACASDDDVLISKLYEQVRVPDQMIG
jgi:hypothetical protein